jgi:vitamin B12 transporter
VGRNNAKGVETMVAYSFSSALKVNANYTFTQVEEPLSRLIPKQEIFLLDYQATPRSFFNINYQFVDKRKDAFFDGGVCHHSRSFRLLSVGQCNG